MFFSIPTRYEVTYDGPSRTVACWYSTTTDAGTAIAVPYVLDNGRLVPADSVDGYDRVWEVR